MARRIIGHYLDEMPGEMEKLTACIDQGDMEAVTRAAHKLKGSAGNLGINELSTSFYAVEKAARDEQAEEVRHLFADIREQYASVSKILEGI